MNCALSSGQCKQSLPYTFITADVLLAVVRPYTFTTADVLLTVVRYSFKISLSLKVSICINLY